jgi:hypothetical protein
MNGRKNILYRPSIGERCGNFILVKILVQILKCTDVKIIVSVDLYIDSSIRLNGVVLNSLSAGTIQPFYLQRF